MDVETHKKLAQLVDTLMEGINPCQWKDGKCAGMRAAEKSCRIDIPYEESSCCRDCEQLSCKGCTTVNLSCKLFYCSVALGNIPEEKRKKLFRLKELLTSKYGYLNHYFLEQEDELQLINLTFKRKVNEEAYTISLTEGACYPDSTR